MSMCCLPIIIFIPPKHMWTKSISWDKAAGVTWFLIQEVYLSETLLYSLPYHRNHVQSLSHVWLCDSVDCSLPAYCVRGIFQARILEWGAISYSRGPFQYRDRTYISCVSCIAGGFFRAELPNKHTLYHIFQTTMLCMFEVVTVL